jgi:hypothetical protein
VHDSFTFNDCDTDGSGAESIIELMVLCGAWQFWMFGETAGVGFGNPAGTGLMLQMLIQEQVRRSGSCDE